MAGIEQARKDMQRAKAIEDMQRAKAKESGVSIPSVFIPSPSPFKPSSGVGGGKVVQQPKPIYDSSGKLVGVDTGTQSRLPTPADILIYGNKGGISSGITTPTTTPTTTNIRGCIKKN